MEETKIFKKKLRKKDIKTKNLNIKIKEGRQAGRQAGRKEGRKKRTKTTGASSYGQSSSVPEHVPRAPFVCTEALSLRSQ